jgi:hypothetical protein
VLNSKQSTAHPHHPIASGTATAAATANQPGFAPQDKSSAVPATTSQAHAAAVVPAVTSLKQPIVIADPTTSSAKTSNSRSAPAPGGATKSAMANEQYQREAERIVAEEREASEKLPYYEGLSERFQLIKKMGE